MFGRQTQVLSEQMERKRCEQDLSGIRHPAVHGTELLHVLSRGAYSDDRLVYTNTIYNVARYFFPEP